MPWPAEALRLERDFSVADVRLHVHDWPGGRDPVVCLPGVSASGRSFDGLAAALAPDWRILAVDPRGRGRSSRPRHGYGYQVHAADTVALIDLLGFEQVVLVGHSFGGIVAALLAAWYPERVRGLVLVDGGAEIPAALRGAIDLVISGLDVVYPSPRAFLDVLSRAPALQPWTPEIADFFRSSLDVLPGGGVRAETRAWVAAQDLRAYWDGPPDFAAVHTAIRCPTLVVRAAGGLAGASGTLLPGPVCARLLAGIRSARLVDVAATHYTVLLGRPSATIAAVKAFLAELGRPTPSSAV